MARLGPVVMKSLKQAHDAPRDSSSSCLKFRTSFRRLTTLEMGKKCKQNLEHSVSQFPCILPTVRLYQCLVFPSKRTKITFILRSRQACQRYASIHMSVQSPIGVSMGFRRLFPRRVFPESILQNTGAAHNQVLG
jgi:hypothetical protein